MNRAAPMMRQSGVYEILNLISGRRYIGSAKRFSARFATHRHMLAKGVHHSKHLQKAWVKYGREAFRFTPILVCAPGDAVFYEQRAIDALSPEYNNSPTAGSCLGMRHTPESRARMSAAQLRNPHFKGKKHAPETVAAMSAAQRGNTATKGKRRSAAAVEKTAAAHRGRKRSDETRARISAAMSGRKQASRSEAWRASLSAALRGRSKSDETRSKISAAKRGKPLSEEHKLKIGEASKAAWAARKKR